MTLKTYGGHRQYTLSSDIDQYLEEISINGYSIVTNVIPEEELPEWRLRIDNVYAQQETEFGRDALNDINELDMCRAPLLYNDAFVHMAANPFVLKVVQSILGDWFILNLQNAIINRPKIEHHQTSWHRDLPYQNFVISRPLAINALYAIDPFSVKTGGTTLLPFSHRREDLPSTEYLQKHQVVADAPPGSVILFDAMLFHRAGSNSSQDARRAVNHLYTAPILKQQYDLPKALNGKFADDAALARLLGYTSEVPLNDKAWRQARAKKRATMKS
ncbi:phytanoyl-CoA dioxygenase family protein [Verrucomicrobia bacterium LW23]|nr:phytanoyl-CoA dioxygenase family protein [Verrucomicrobia bacterium LW23]